MVILFVYVYRDSIFHLESPPSPANPAGAGGTVTNTASSDNNSVTTAVDFKEDVPWTKAWNAGIAELGQGHFQEALEGFDSARRLAGSNRVKVRGWIQFFEGLTLLAADRPNLSVNSFAKGIDPGAPKGVPAEITPANFVDPLLMVMMNGLPLNELDQAAARMPAWAKALTYLCTGFKHLEEGDLAPAAEFFHRYATVPPTDNDRWAFQMQPLADKLARNCDHALELLREVGELQTAGKVEPANERLQQAIHDTPSSMIKPVLEKRAASLQPALAQLAAEREKQRAEEARRRELQATHDRERAAEEAKFVQSIDPQIIPFLQKYDFRGAHEKYLQVGENVSTPLGRQLLQNRLDATDRLVQFKQQLIADVTRQAFPGDQLHTKSNVPVSGNLTRATDSELFFGTQYGELAQSWTEFLPGELLKVAGSYATTSAASEPAASQARRYLMLALFAKQYGLDRAVDSYSQRAIQLQPAIEAELKRLTGKTQP